jgi:hypothetical protein
MTVWLMRCGSSAILNNALAEQAENYGDQTAQDHATWADSMKRGKTKAQIEVKDEG